MVPEYIEVKLAYIDDSIYSFDLLIFACEELFRLYVDFFAQNEMIERIKELKVGDLLDEVLEITMINAELDVDNYHNVGISLLNRNFPDSKPS